MLTFLYQRIATSFLHICLAFLILCSLCFYFTDVQFLPVHHTFTAPLQAMVSNIICRESISFSRLAKMMSLLRECTRQ